MEQTNNPNDINQPVETSSINPVTPKPNNIYKYLFFITLILLFGVIGYFVTTNSKNPQPQISQKKSLNQTTKTIETINENKKEQNTTNVNAPYRAISVEDDKNSVTKLILIDQDNNETVIDEMKYWQINQITMQYIYKDFIFSLDNNFLYYNRYSGYEEASSFLYDITNKKVLQLNFFSETKGFTSDSKYFYACSVAGMNGGGAIIKDLISLNNIFNPDNEGDDSYKCQYDKNIGEVIFYENDIYSNNAEKIVSQYKFSEKTGVLTKIK